MPLKLSTYTFMQGPGPVGIICHIVNEFSTNLSYVLLTPISVCLY